MPRKPLAPRARADEEQKSFICTDDNDFIYIESDEKDRCVFHRSRLDKLIAASAQGVADEDPTLSLYFEGNTEIVLAFKRPYTLSIALKEVEELIKSHMSTKTASVQEDKDKST